MTTWWDTHLPARTAEYLEWIGGPDAPSRVAVRKYVASMGYRTLLDVGCGPAIDRDGYAADGYPIFYAGVDSSQQVVDMAVARGVNAVRRDARALEFGNGTFDVVTIRHILEHVEDYRPVLAEAIRVAKCEVIVTFFIPPTDKLDAINFDPHEQIYHNAYNHDALVAWLWTQPRVAFIESKRHDTETIMNIKVKP